LIFQPERADSGGNDAGGELVGGALVPPTFQLALFFLFFAVLPSNIYFDAFLAYLNDLGG
jgi:hypothetical protein